MNDGTGSGTREPDMTETELLAPLKRHATNRTIHDDPRLEKAEARRASGPEIGALQDAPPGQITIAWDGDVNSNTWLYLNAKMNLNIRC
ncbi:hypothetical protein [Paraburkholderia humisilvae]|nr:hypothetical protein [Paraburkholderia humisilvae]